MRPPETKSLLDYEKWVQSKECEYCLDWTGKDPYNHSLTLRTWDIWEPLKRIQEAEDEEFIRKILEVVGVDK